MKYCSLIVLFISLCACTHAEDTQNKGPLAPSKNQQITTLEVVRKLQSRHFEKRAIDDALSRSFLENYIDALDNGRQVFLKSDIDNFTKQYAKQLDDAIKRGDTQAGFTIFNIYHSKNTALLEKFIKAMPENIKQFDYSKDESTLIDRSKAPWPVNAAEVDAIWLNRIKAAALGLKLAGKNNDEITELLTKRYQNQLDRLKKIRSDDVYQIYMNAFTELYDPHTNYMSPASSDNFDISMSLKLEGIGAILSSTDEYTQVVRLIHAGPAQKQGELKPLDRIVAVGQGEKDKLVDVVGWRLDEVVNLIRGPKGSTVRIEVIPAKASDDQRKLITIVRDEVKLEEQSVQKAMLNIKDANGITRKIGVLDVPTFYIDFEALRKRDPNYKSTTRDTARLLSELVNEGAEGIIIDLRDNGGGSLREANELTGLFIEKGPSVQIRHADNRTYAEAKTYYSPYYDGPLVVLINRMSASASEIFAGAIQDYQRGLIIGSPSFGKGTVQSLSDLTHGKLKITESKFYRISGKSTQHLGIMPDISLPAIYDESLVGESALDKAMAWDAIAPMNYKTYLPLQPVVEKLGSLSKARAANDPDFIYIQKRAEFEKNLRSETLSLNEQLRLRERENNKATQLKLLNEKRVAKGEEPLKALDEDLEEENEDKIVADEDTSNKIDAEDPYLKEAAHILLDLEKALPGQLTAQTQN